MTEESDFYDDEMEGGTTGNRTFNLLAGIAAAIFLMGLLCIAAVWLIRGTTDSNRQDEIAAIETQNAIIAITNEAVTRTLEAIATEDARPTDTPTSTPEPSPTSTPEPTNTPVVLPVDDEDDAVDDETDATPDSLATAIAEADEDDEAAVATPVSAVTPGAPVDTLPDTGLDTWGVALLAFLLIGMFMAARRLRSA
jgi:hypothetical protein